MKQLERNISQYLQTLCHENDLHELPPPSLIPSCKRIGPIKTPYAYRNRVTAKVVKGAFAIDHTILLSEQRRKRVEI